MAGETQDTSVERTDGPTPNGGAYALAHFRDMAGKPCPKDKAHSVEITEHDHAGKVIHRTYMTR